MSQLKQKTNELINASSPYLRQHAHNPVDWLPWGKEALEKARSENKPILLSIGYAACHWCHVMAHESFEDDETAELMNELFINIKVDREERPDLDKIYQTAHYVLTQSSGGWPLTVFLTPQDLVPFFSGTYFPKEPHYHLPAFKDVLKIISSLFKNNSLDIQQQNKELVNILQKQILQSKREIDINDQPLQKALFELKQQFDLLNGGFGSAPKFPQPSKLEFLLLENQSAMVVETLKQMANGGICDQLQGGFFRYSVDANWQIPHFEKMLYDNAQLTYLYAISGQLYHNAYFKQISNETAEWALQKMQAATQGYYASIDADSEGQEGKFYLWQKSEIQTILNEQEYAVVNLHFGLDKNPNFENHYHLTINQPLEAIAEQLNLPLAQAKHLLNTAKEKLLSARDQRTPPETDKKILTAWNALMIKGMLMTGYYLQENRYIASALETIQFIKQNLWQQSRLLASYTEGKNQLPGYLDDYAFLIDALITSLQITWRTEHLHFAIELANKMLDHFYDPINGGFFFTADDQEKVIYRPKTMVDEALPSGNGVAIRVLLWLGHLLGETRYLKAAEKSLQASWPFLERLPSEHCAVLVGLKEYLSPSKIIVIRGNEKEIQTWQTACPLSPSRLIFAIPNAESDLPGSLALRKSNQKTIAYICQGPQCTAAITEIEAFRKQVEFG